MRTAAITTIGAASRARAPALVLFGNIGSPGDGELGVRSATGSRGRAGGPRRAAVWDPGPFDQPAPPAVLRRCWRGSRAVHCGLGVHADGRAEQPAAVPGADGGELG